jgi:hypothetical protein
VFPDLGLCVSLYEILAVEGGTVYQLDGAATFSVTFNMVSRKAFVTPQLPLAANCRRRLLPEAGEFLPQHEPTVLSCSRY